MAKIIPGPLHPEAMPHVRGVIYTRDTKYGPVCQSWPTKRKRTTDRSSVWYRELFAIAARMASNPHSLDYQTAVEMVKGTQYVPRDWLMMCIYGKAYDIEMPDGTVLVPTWKGPPELDPSIPPEPEPEPEEIEMAWQWSLYDKAWNDGNSTSSFAFKGSIFVPQVAAICKGIRVVAQVLASNNYRIILARMETATKLGEILVTHDIATTVQARALFEAPANLNLEAGKTYVCMMGRTSGSPTSQFQIPMPAAASFLWPCTLTTGARLASINPQPGDTLDVSAVGTIPFGLLLNV